MAAPIAAVTRSAVNRPIVMAPANAPYVSAATPAEAPSPSRAASVLQSFAIPSVSISAKASAASHQICDGVRRRVLVVAAG